MPNRELLEKYPLYRGLKGLIFVTYEQIPKPSIKMFCEVDRSDQTFNMVGDYGTAFGVHPRQEVKGGVGTVRYVCAGCNTFSRHFTIHIAVDDPLKQVTGKTVSKVGQFPPWSIAGDPIVESLLGDHKGYLSKGLICESQGYGIGAFGYYRRIVEEIIDSLLSQVSSLIPEDEKETYAAALEKVKATRVTADKIELVKDLLPAILRPNNMNPLKALHETLSEGLHAETDERCLELAMAVREVVVFLADRIAETVNASDKFTMSLRRLLKN